MTLLALEMKGQHIEGLGQVFPELLPAIERQVWQARNRKGLQMNIEDVKILEEDYNSAHDEDLVPYYPNLLPDALLKRRMKGMFQKGKYLSIMAIADGFDLPDLAWAICRYLEDLPASKNQLPGGFTPEHVKGMTARIFNKLEVPIINVHDECEVVQHPIRAVRNWRNKGPRNDFVLYQKSAGSQKYGALEGRGVARTELVFQLTDPFLRKAQNLVFLTELNPVANGQVHYPSGLVRVEAHPKLDYLKEDLQPYNIIVNIKSILYAAYLVSEQPNTDMCRSTKWFVNSNIDLTVYNEIY